MTKNYIKEKYLISEEVFCFYLEVGAIKSLGEDNYSIVDGLIIEKSTVYKHYFSDTFLEDIKNFANTIKYNSNVKVYSKEEIERYKKEKGIK